MGCNTGVAGAIPAVIGVLGVHTAVMRIIGCRISAKRYDEGQIRFDISTNLQA
jgi:hypothetical protein